MPSAEIPRPSVHITAPLRARCPCGTVLHIAPPATLVTCSGCGARWQLRVQLTEVVATDPWRAEPDDRLDLNRPVC